MVGFSVCSWRHQLADHHLLPFPSLPLNEGPPSRCFDPPFLFLERWRVASTKTLRIHTALHFTLKSGGKGGSRLDRSVLTHNTRWNAVPWFENCGARGMLHLDHATQRPERLDEKRG